MSTSFPPFIHMISTGRFRLTFLTVLLLLGQASAWAQTAPPDASLFRIFLRDGTTLVSYGEFARVGDRLVVSLPIGGTPEAPELHLLSIPADRVDWERTDAYSDSVRATRYAATSGPNDFALLSEAVSRALGDIGLAPDPGRKLAMAAEARQNVTKWVAEHYGYRAEDAAHMANLFDQAAADARAAAGLPNYDLALIAGTAAPPSVPLLPMPSEEESADQAMRAVTLAPDATERLSLLRAIQKAMGGAGEAAWAAPMRARVASALALEERTSKSYETLTRDTLASANRLARAADVTGVERVIRRALTEDDRLGQRRPQEMAALLATLDGTLDEARRLRLARDSWAARAEELRKYRTAVEAAVTLMRTSRASLDEIRRLAGPPAARLQRLAARTAEALKVIAALEPPAEGAAAHGLLTNAIQLAARAAEGRRQAILKREMKPAWEASSAAAGSLIFFDRAVEELQALAKIPDAAKPRT
jgi:hypothetical protein